MAFSCLAGALKTPRKVNGYGADYAWLCVPKGCAEAYRQSDYYNRFLDQRIVETGYDFRTSSVANSLELFNIKSWDATNGRGQAALHTSTSAQCAG